MQFMSTHDVKKVGGFVKLKEYLDKWQTPIMAFARKVGVTAPTIQTVLKDSCDIHLSTAIAIEQATDGMVTCKELLPSDFQKKRKEQKTDGRGKKKNS